jgi:mannan endo-1,4-beta-mannosidase
MKKLSLFFLMTIIFNTMMAQTTMHVAGRYLLDPCNDTIILRGVNYAAFNWGWDQNEELSSEIAQTGANAVRITWYEYANGAPYYTPANLDTIITRVIRKKMIPIVDLHDQTCYNNPNAVIALANYLLRADIKPILIKHQRSLIINVVNEALHYQWTGNAAAAQQTYLTTYNTVVANLRNGGLIMPLMIDAPDCGQDISIFNNVATTMQNADPLHNLIFSGHSYWYYFANNDAAIARQKVQAVLNNNIPFVIGEAANYQDDNGGYCNYLLNYAQFLTEFKALKVGFLHWSWNRDNCAPRQMSNNGYYNNLSPYGNDLVNNTVYGLKYAKRSKFLLNNQSCTVGVDNDFDKNTLALYTGSNGWVVTSTNTEPLTLGLTDVTGRTLSTTVLQPFSSENIDFPAAAGIYLLTINGHFYKKVVR